jgi:Flp pilus assembly protein TadG
MTLKAPWTRAAAGETGAAMVELAVALPILVALLVGTADFARVFYTAIEMTNAARAGAQYGAKNIGAGKDPTLIQNAATSSVNVTGLSAAASRVCECAHQDGSAWDVVNCDDPPATACSSPTFRVITITVTVTKTFTTIAPYPGIPRSLPLTRVAKMRVSE